MSFLCAHWSFMWFYDDILIKAISHSVGTVIKNIPTHRGFITALLWQMEDARTEDKRMMNVRTNLNVLHCSCGLNFGGRLKEDVLLCCHLNKCRTVFEWCNLKEQYCRIWNCLLFFAESINILSVCPLIMKLKPEVLFFLKTIVKWSTGTWSFIFNLQRQRQ